MKKILIVGQTPPPFGGQAIMIQRLLEGKYKHAELVHIRMAFSKEMDDMGRMQLGKLLHALSLVLQIIYAKFRHGITTIYYPPSGSDLLPMLRDMAVLASTRWLFKTTIFHFHAAGISEIYGSLPWVLKLLYRISFFKPDLAIQLSEFNPADGAFLQAKHTVIIPNGIVDDFAALGFREKPTNSVCNILFVGLVTESKGVLVLVDAMHCLRQQGREFKLSIVGKFSSDEFRDIVFEKIRGYGLDQYIECTGVLTGKPKFDAYQAADIFCFPTFFESESFGLVVAEAMQFKVPVVVSKWRGVQSLVDEGINGYCVPVHDSVALGERLAQLIDNPVLRRQMGVEGRRLFSENYTVSKFHERMDQCFESI